MARLLTIFNLLAGAASIAGLYVSLALGYTSYALATIFVLTLVMSLYVLAVPGTPLERNVQSKIVRFTLPAGPEEVAIQRGEFSLDSWGPTAVEFYEPFVHAPEVEVIATAGSRGVIPSPVQVTPHHVVFRRESVSAPAERETFRWVARGILLNRISS
jgi:hypothetical protein